jgi:hypothetical protein
MIFVPENELSRNQLQTMGHRRARMKAEGGRINDKRRAMKE